MELKKFKLSALALLGVVTSGCNTNEEINMPEKNDNQITFNVVSQNLTRASNSYCNNNKPSQFKVTAFNGTVNYFGESDNIDIVTPDEQSNTWRSDHVRYWPQGTASNWEGLTFYAYVEDTEGVDSGTESASEDNVANDSFKADNGVAKFEDFVVNTDVSKQIDLLYAVAKDRDHVVNLKFRHALSQICFTAQNRSSYKEIEIQSIKLSGVKGKGSFTFPTNPTDNAYDTHGNSSPVENTNAGTWTTDPLSSPATYTISLLG